MSGNQVRRSSSEYSQSSGSISISTAKPKIAVDESEKKHARATIYKYVFSNWMACVGIIPSFALGAIPIFTFLIFGDIITPFTRYAIESMTKVDPFDPMPSLLKQIYYMIAVAVASGLCKVLDSFFWIRVGSNVATKLKNDLFTSMMKNDVTFFDTNPIGSLLTVLSEDAQDVENAFGHTKGTQFQNIGQFLMAIIMSFIKDWRLALICLCTIPVMAIVTAILIPGIIKYAQIKFQHVSKSMTMAEETLSSIRTVKGCNREDLDKKMFMKETIASAKAEHRIGAFLVGLIVSIQVVIWGTTIGILYYGATLVKKGKMDSGDLFSVYGYTMFGCMGIVMLLSSMQGEQKAITSGARILKLTSKEPSIPFEGGKKIENFKGHIEFKNVSFKYPTRDVYVLRNVSFEVKPGEMAALVGHSGSGKSTCVQLLERYYDAEGGVVLLDGEDIREIDPRWLHINIGLVQQEPSLFKMTIKENIKYGASNATDEEVYAAADIANARKFIEKLDHGFEQQVGDRGVDLSGGQRQRIAIARAVIKNPVILITDEATSALDSQSEKKVQYALDKVMQGRTAVVVAHRLSTIRNAHTIYVFDAGEIKEIGNHDSLVKLGGFYYNLVKRQMTQQENIKAKSQINKNDDTSEDDDDDEDSEKSSNRVATVETDDDDDDEENTQEDSS
ncbi:hypothetical protein M9Y10_026825 [Tritrichomonas musculus]|uniref:ABC transporter family protein n=1 Tax=Tritrichomonas musculus TaxID=1915356 RepID=A0ABR2H6M4_9EUKA